MSRRLPIMPLTFAATFGLFSLTSVLLAQPPKAPPEIKPVDIRGTQQENAKLYQRFADELLRLAQRWEKSDNQDEKERAKALRAALKIADEKGVKNLFEEIVKGLGNANPTGGDFNNILGKDAKLIAALDEILRTLETEDDADRIKREIKELKELIAEIEKHKRDQENIRARTENPKGDPEKIARDQAELAKRTAETANKFPGSEPKTPPSAGGMGEPKDPKAEPKPETKPGDANPEAKPDTKENKSDNKAGMGDPMSGDPKAGGEPKPMPMGGKPAGDDKESPKAGGDPKDPKAGGDSKPMGGMDPKDPKNPMDPKDPKNPMGGMDPKNPMAGEPKPSDSKAQGEGKGDPKPSDGMPGGEGKPMDPSGMPMAGGPPSASKPSPGGPPMPGGGQPPPPGGPQKPKDDAQENVQQAVPQQEGAENDIKKNKPEDASKKQDEAIAKLEKALKELEKRLKQLREKELEKLLANLEERVGRMLRMQIEVYEATKKIHEGVTKNNNQKTTADVQKSQSEADKEQAIVVEADKTLKLMEGEGSAVVFAGVLAEVRNDMIAVQKRLNEGRVEGRRMTESEGTQLIEEQIIEQLTMMKEALKKAKQDLQDSKSKPGEPKEGGKQDKKLIDLINELKLIKSLQEQVNKRTVSHEKQDPGAQAKDPIIQAELKQLSDRQKVLQEMLHKIATQANQ
ncbi:MAG: hypothetical protein C0467_16730 [Planctomycetaceae bacterium]|nr:hypothetical protein [Planctomycetaceae bacterium]